MKPIPVEEKYERNGWPSLARPDAAPAEGWSLSLITSVQRIYNHRLSPDGKQAAFLWNVGDLADVYALPVEGKSLHWPSRLTTEREPVPYWWDDSPKWSPDGRWIAISMKDHVHIIAAEGGIPRKISHFAAQASSPVWMPDGSHLVVSVDVDENSKLFRLSRDGRSVQSLTGGPGDDLDARPSPDGRMVAFAHTQRDDLNRWDVRLLDIVTGQTRTLAGAPKQKNWSPRWSPDGKRLAFLSQRSGFAEAWLASPDGSDLRQLTHLGMDVAHLAWSPDGRQIACTVNRQGALDLALIDAESGEVRDLCTGHGLYSQIQWSPQGDFLTVEYEDPQHPPDLYRIDLAGGARTQLTFSNPPALRRVHLVVPEPVSYSSFDGLQIPALLYRPEKPNGAALLYPHGGPTDQYVYSWDIFAQYLVAKGYTFLAVNYRGSTGYGVAYEHANYNNWGVGDTQDCLYGARYLASLAWIDPQRIGIMGGSYGGYLVANCLARDPDYLFACGISRYGDANLTTSWAQCERVTRLYTEMQISRPALNPKVYAAGSPIDQVENIRKPVLVLHGLDDKVVPPQASEEWVEALRRCGKTYEYKTYAGEPHGFLKRENQLDSLERIERFLDWYLMPPFDEGSKP